MADAAAGPCGEAVEHVAVEAEVEGEGQGHPHHAPGRRLLEGDRVGLAVEDAQVQGQQDAHEGGEAGVEPPVLARTGRADAVVGITRAPACRRLLDVHEARRPPSRSVWPRKRASSGRGKSVRKWPPRLSSRKSAEPAMAQATSARLRVSAGRAVARARRGPARAAVQEGRAARAGPSRVALQAQRTPRRAAAARRARRRSGRRTAAGRRSGASAAGAGWSSAAMASAARAPKTSPSSSELLARRLAPCTPVAGHLARGVEARQRRAAVEVGGHAAHDVVGGRRHRDRVAA